MHKAYSEGTQNGHFPWMGEGWKKQWGWEQEGSGRGEGKSTERQLESGGISEMG